ncbi:MAG: SHOCT domain-containing protein, partial [Bacillota bacterium]|nr:SHOCT domain-containing protein [Bacillota bacterium]
MSTNIELIRQYKQLLDDGVITEEEFEKKKKELLEHIEISEP